MPDISAAEALRLAKGGARLVDVREADEWMRGHSTLASHLPMSQLQSRVSELPDDEQLLIVCHSGGRSQRVTEALNGAGYDAVNVVGGMLAWASAGGELVADGAEAPSVD